MTQRNIDIMGIIVDKMAEGEKLSQALKAVYTKRNVVLPYDEDMENVGIMSLGMSNRTTNALMRSRLQTIGDVVNYCNRQKITMAQGVGNNSGVELFEAMIDYCWSHMNMNAKELFLIDVVDRNTDNIREDIT